jgi:hypothetical protein
MRHPKHSVIFRADSCVIDCSVIASIVASADVETGPWTITVGFYGGDRTVRLCVGDREEATCIVASLERGMVAAQTGDWRLLEGFGDDESGQPAE